jgi:phage tail sheath protein FI
MPSALTHPGVYVEELTGGARPIAGVSTSTTAFVGFFNRGPVDRPQLVSSFADFTRQYGGLDLRSEAAYSVSQFFVNGGQRAVILRVGGTGIDTADATWQTAAPGPTFTVAASSPGEWGDQLQVGVENVGADAFNLVARQVREVDSQDRVVATETHLNLSMSNVARRYAVNTVNATSNLIRLTDDRLVANLADDTRPAPDGTGLTAAAKLNDVTDTDYTPLTGGADGNAPTRTQIQNALPTLDLIAPLFYSMLCIPDMATMGNADFSALVGAANGFCRQRRVFLLVDPNIADTVAAAVAFDMSVGERNNAVFVPGLELADPLADGALRRVPPSGTMAGIFARTDTERGIWKAPAGTAATIRGANIAGQPFTEADSGRLNPVGINALRSLPVFGNVVWGSRTGDGADQRASEWKYVPVRRTALYIEESLVQGLQWVVFEPNDEPLWAQIRLSVGGFMQTLFRKGAFQGSTPTDAYLVRCDETTTTQTDIDNGVVNILVGFAPLKPAEFVVIQLQQLTAEAV